MLDVCKTLEGRGFSITYLEVDRAGRIDLNALDQPVTGDTVLVSLMGANNEVVTLHPLAEIGALCKARGVFFTAMVRRPQLKLRSMSSRWELIYSHFLDTNCVRPKA